MTNSIEKQEILNILPQAIAGKSPDILASARGYVAKAAVGSGAMSGEIRVNCICQDGQGQDKTLGINLDTGVFHCHRCGIKGNYLKVNGSGSEKKPLAQYIWDHSLSMTSHPYTEKKQIKPIEIKVDKHSN